MAFKPMNSGNKSSSNTQFEQRNYPVPRKGSRPARVSMLVDLGVQEREDDDKGNPRKPCQQVAMFVDLVKDVVDYGGSIGKQPYRLMLNKSFKGDLVGINFVATPPKDADGNIIQGKQWGFHPANVLTKLAKAVGREDVIESMEADQLLNYPVRVEVEVKETPAKNGKTDDDGNPIIYKNVSFKQFGQLIVNDDDEIETVPDLPNGFRLVTFDTATKEDIAWLRRDVISKIKLASNYAGSQIQKAIKEFEADKPAPKQQEEKQEAPAKAVKPVKVEEEDDTPF